MLWHLPGSMLLKMFRPLLCNVTNEASKGYSIFKKEEQVCKFITVKGRLYRTVPLVELSLLVAGPRTSGHLSVAGNKLKMPKEKNADNCTQN